LTGQSLPKLRKVIYLSIILIFSHWNILYSDKKEKLVGEFFFFLIRFGMWHFGCKLILDSMSSFFFCDDTFCLLNLLFFALRPFYENYCWISLIQEVWSEIRDPYSLIKKISFPFKFVYNLSFLPCYKTNSLFLLWKMAHWFLLNLMLMNSNVIGFKCHWTCWKICVNGEGNWWQKSKHIDMSMEDPE